MRTQKLLAALLSSAMVLGTMAVPVLADGNEAKIGTTEYATLEAAADAANEGDTITLLNNVTYEANHSVDVWEKAFNLNLGGKTITTESSVDIDLSNMGYKAAAVCYANDGNVAITNGTIQTAYGAGIYAAGTVATLSDLTITAATTTVQPTKEYSSAVRLSSEATVIINSGSYTAENGGYSIAVSNSGGAVTINGGTFNGDIFFSKNTNSGVTKSITINGGTFTGDFINTDKGTLTITGGTFTSDPSAYVADGYAATQNDNVWTVAAVVEESYVAQIGDQKYETLAAAAAAAANGATIKLLSDVALTETVEITKDLTIDLNGKSISATDARALWVKQGNVNITGNGTVSADGSNLSPDKSVIRVGSSGAPAKLTIDKNVTVSSATCYGVTVFGTNSTIELVMNGAVRVTGTKNGAISGNGTGTYSDTTMTINGIVTSTKDYAIYHPGSGSLTIDSNADIKGEGGIEAKAGTVTINGGKITATHSPTAHSPYQNGPSTLGYALAAVNNSGYKGNATFNVNGGTFTGPVDVVTDNVDKNADITITGGTFTSNVKDYVADGYAAYSENPNYKVKPVAQLNEAQMISALSSATETTPVTIKSAVDKDGNYDQVTGVAISSGDSKIFTVTSTGFEGERTIELQKIAGDTHIDGGILCGLIITGIPAGVTVTVQ